MKRTIIFLIVITSIVILSALDTAIAPKMVYIQISRDGSVPPEGTITFDASLNTESLMRLTQESPNCGYFPVHGSGYGVVYADITQLYNEVTESHHNWSSGEVIRFHILYDNEPQYKEFYVNHTLGDGCFETSESTSNFVPLAVTLSSFTAVYNGDNVSLQWITQSETSNAGWNVFRSTTEVQDEALQINPELLPGHGTTTEPQQYTFEDTEVETGTTCYYWLESVDYSGSSESYGPIELLIPENGGETPPPVDLIYGLHNAYPNPFNPETTIQFILSEPTEVDLAIYNIKGQKVVSLYDNFEDRVNEPISVHWNGKDSFGRDTGSGIYFYQLKTTGNTQIKKMVLVK